MFKKFLLLNQVDGLAEPDTIRRLLVDVADISTITEYRFVDDTMGVQITYKGGYTIVVRNKFDDVVQTFAGTRNIKILTEEGELKWVKQLK